LWVLGPLGLGAHHAAAHSSADEGGFQLEGVSARDGGVDLVGAGVAVESELVQNLRAVMKGPVELHVAPVLGGHDPRDEGGLAHPAGARVGWLLTHGAREVVRAEAGGRVAGVHHDLLAPTGPQPPQLVGGQPGQQADHGAAVPEVVGRREDGVLADDVVVDVVG
jgi:hypothetical protein